MFLQWAQLKHAIPPRCKNKFFDYSNINKNDLSQNHHGIKREFYLLTNYPLMNYIQFYTTLRSI